MVQKVHAQGIEFNYLLNASCMGNTEYTREGQRAIRSTLDWVASIGRDSVTVGGVHMLQLFKRCHPQLKVRISAHRFTDSPRKARLWEDHGADCIVLNETCRYCHELADAAVSIDPAYREEVLAMFKELLEGMHEGDFWGPNLKSMLSVVGDAVRKLVH